MAEQEPGAAGWLSRALVLGAAGLALLAGGILFCLSLQSHQFFAKLILPLTLSKSLHFFTPAYWQAMAFKLKMAAGLLGVLAVLGLVWRCRLAGELAGLGRSFQVVGAHAWAGLKTEWRAAGPVLMIALALTVLAGLAARLHVLDAPIRYDEAGTLFHFAGRPLWIGISYYPLPNNHILNTILVHFAVAWLGDQVWALRLPALLAGLFTLPATYLVMARLGWRRAGLVASGLAAVSWPMVLFATNARGYSLVGLFFALLILLTLYLREHREPAAWSLWALCAGLGCLAVPTMLFPLCALSVFWLGLALLDPGPFGRLLRLRETVPALAATAGLTVVFYLPALVASGLDNIIGNKFVKTASITSWSLGAYLLDLGEYLTRGWPAWLVLLLGLGLAVCLVRPGGGNRLAWLLGWASLLGCLALLAIHGHRPFFRVWTFVPPLLLGLAAAGLIAVLQGVLKSWSRRGRDWAATLLCLGLMAGALPTWLPRVDILEHQVDGSFADGKELAAYLKPRLEPGDLVLATLEGRYTMLYYLSRQGVPTRQIPEQAPDCSWRRAWLVGGKEEPLSRLLALASCPSQALPAPRPMRETRWARLFLIEKGPQP